jgi:signal peptidase I
VIRKHGRLATEETDVASPETDSSRKDERPLFGRGLRVLLVVALLVVLIPVFIARVYAIPSGSMETTLHGCTGCNNDRVLVDKLAYKFSTPQPGDIVVFIVPDSWHNTELPQAPVTSNPLMRALGSIGAVFGMEQPDQTDFIKRVIAVGGQTVSCCDARNRLIVDGKSVDEPYVYFAPEFGKAQQAAFGPVRVPPGSLWVMGDSRNNSVDSRAAANGPVPVRNVIGKARWIVLPLYRFGAIGSSTGSTDDQ